MDDLTALVRSEVEAGRPAAAPPFAELVARHRWRARRRQGLAAAAVALAVTGVVVVAVPDREQPAPAPLATVALDGKEQPREGDVAPPDFTSPRGGPSLRTCSSLRGAVSWDVRGDVVRGKVLLTPAPGSGDAYCYVGGRPRLAFSGPADGLVGPEAVLAEQPDVPTAPALPSLVASGAGVVVPFTLTGSNCVPADAVNLSGVVGLVITAVPEQLPCDRNRPDADGELVVGVAHTQGTPAALVPEDRARLRVSLELPASARDGDPIAFTAVLTNPTDRAVTLDPCPSWGAAQGREDSTSSSYGGRSGRLPCEQLPDAIAPGSALRFSLSLDDVATGQPGEHDAARTTVRWGIAGPEAAEGTVAYVR